MPIREQTRLILPTLALSGLLLIVGSVAAWYLHHAQRKSARALALTVTRVQATEELMLFGAQLQLMLDQFMVSGNVDALAQAESTRSRISAWIERFDELAESDEDRHFVRRIRFGYAQFHQQFNLLIESPPDEAQRSESISESRRGLQTLILDPSRKYQAYNRDRLARATDQARSLADSMGAVLLFLGVSGSVAGLMAGYAAARRVQQRMIAGQEAIAHSEQLAALGRVAAALAHELRNPLTSMRIIVQSVSIDHGRASMEAKELEILADEIERLDGSIQLFLDYARPPKPEIRPCDLQKQIDETLALVRRRAALIGVDIQRQLPEEAIQVNVDPSQIKQVLLNLLLNSLEASPSGGMITIAASVIDSGSDESDESVPVSYGAHVKITITDRGSGLPANLGDRIFDAFVSTKETGTGLGLAICKRIIEDHGGQITAADAEPVGTVFTIRLPHRKAQRASHVNFTDRR